MASGGVGGAIFLEIRPGAGFQTGDFVTGEVGGVTVERLASQPET